MWDCLRHVFDTRALNPRVPRYGKRQIIYSFGLEAQGDEDHNFRNQG